MEDILREIRLAVLTGNVAFTLKARQEMGADNLMDVDVYQSLMNARAVRSKRSRSPFRKQAREKVWIIVAPTDAGIRIYTKGVLRKKKDKPVFYVLISAKRSTDAD
ncbi:hypothetical protein HY522_03415 [bacterium]|nr:hypothetical protein [bacterium]